MNAAGHTGVPFERGDLVTCRAAHWTLIDIEQGAGCLGLDLLSDAAHLSRTLLAPFDRFRLRPGTRAPRVVRPARWLKHLRALRARCHPAGSLRAAAGAACDLHPYQIEPALAVLRHGAMRVLIADAVGLGKTVQAGLILAELAGRSADFRALVLVPAGLRDQWAAELRRFFALHSCFADAGWIRAAAIDRPAGSNPWALPGIYLASQDFVKRPEVLRPIEDLSWDLLVVDEAHNVSAGTDRRTAADAIAARADRVVLLTATPPASDPTGFAALCSIGRTHEGEAPLTLFQRSHADAGAPATRRSTLLGVRTTADEQRMHDLLERYTTAVLRESRTRGDTLARLAAIVLRKRALSSAGSLAASVRRRMALLAGEADEGAAQLRLPLGDEDPVADEVPADVLGAPGLAHAARERRWLALIAEAAESAGRAESKSRVLRRLLARVREPAIVFTEYRDTLIRLSRTIWAPGRQLLVLHGGMTAAERSRVHARFAREDAVLLATDAAAEGLNLQARCRLVIHYELPWSLSRLEQRAGRVDRLGQARRVHEIGLVADATAERLVLEPLIRRASRLRASGTGRHGLAAALTESRVADLIAGERGPGLPAAAARADENAIVFLRLDLRKEAEAEVQRLAAIRRGLEALRREGRQNPERRTLVSSIRRTRSSQPPGFFLVYLITLTDSDGREVHVESAVLHVHWNLQLRGRLSAGALGRAFESCRHASPADVARTVSNAAARAAADAAVVHRRVSEALLSRQQTRAARRAAASTRLVQQGLFVRRGARPRSEAERAGTPPAAAPGNQSIFVLGVDVALAAALLVHQP